MNAEELLRHYERVADAGDAIPRLRRFVLSLAVRGKLVSQDCKDEPSADLLKRIGRERAKLHEAGSIKKPEAGQVAADEQLFSIPPTWIWTRLGAIGDWGSGSTPARSNSAFYGEGLCWFKSGELNDDKELLAAEEKVTDLALAKCTFRRNRVGDVLMAMYGATIGKVGILAVDAVTNQAVCGCTPLPGAFNQYLFHFLIEQREQFQLASEGGAQPNISKAKIVQTPFPLPPLAEQHRIVAKVDELMALCDRLEAARAEREAARDRLAAANLARLNAADSETLAADARFALDALPAIMARPDQIRQLRQTILNVAVRGQLSPTGALQSNAVRLGTVASLQNGYAFKSEWFSKSGTRLLRNANVGHGTLNWTEEVRLPAEKCVEYERFRLQEGDVVLSLDRPFIGTGTKASQVESKDLPALLLQRVGRFVLSAALDPTYLLLWINSPHFSDQIDPGRSNGVPHISSKQVESALLFLPSVSEQRRIVAKVDELMALCDRLEASLSGADDHRSRLLKALLNQALAPTDELEQAA